jgi:hypothetical protein
MVINNYAGMPFSQLERGFAGLMIRDDEGGSHFDARTVKLKFSLAGENGIFMPLVLDLDRQHLHWLDVHAKGQLEMNNVANSNSDIATICPTLMSYFDSGSRPSMYDLGLLHVAARCDHVIIRGESPRLCVRQEGEPHISFLSRLRCHESGIKTVFSPPSAPVLAMLCDGDIDLSPGSTVYTLFREQSVPTITASELLSNY